jgi:hypothetical protein
VYEHLIVQWVHWTNCALCPLLSVSCGDAGLALFTLTVSSPRMDYSAKFKNGKSPSHIFIAYSLITGTLFLHLLLPLLLVTLLYFNKIYLVLRTLNKKFSNYRIRKIRISFSVKVINFRHKVSAPRRLTYQMTRWLPLSHPPLNLSRQFLSEIIIARR